jgi:hypothetical protein
VSDQGTDPRYRGVQPRNVSGSGRPAQGTVNVEARQLGDFLVDLCYLHTAQFVVPVAASTGKRAAACQRALSG